MAPTAWATVFKVRIAIKGLSTSFFSISRDVANVFPSYFFTLMKVGVTLNSTASRMEHTNETKIEINA
jgi:hypothetical protein